MSKLPPPIPPAHGGPRMSPLESLIWQVVFIFIISLIAVSFLIGMTGCGVPSVDNLNLTYNEIKMPDQDMLMERAWKLYGGNGTAATGAPIYWLESGNCHNNQGFMWKDGRCLDGVTITVKVTEWDTRVAWIAVERRAKWYALSHELLHAAISQQDDWGGDVNHTKPQWNTLWPEAQTWAE